jgi:hypothetical protein
MVDLQEAVRLSSKSGDITGLEVLETSGHRNALDELSQKMLQKEPSLLTGLISRLAGLENTITGILVLSPHTRSNSRRVSRNRAI